VSQNFAKDPRLTLPYFRLCYTDPDAFIFNDECLNGPECSATCQRILRAIGRSVGQAESARCQMSAAARDPGSGRLAACASCNEVLL
jgi:hypothetical protein